MGCKYSYDWLISTTNLQVLGFLARPLKASHVRNVSSGSEVFDENGPPSVEPPWPVAWLRTDWVIVEIILRVSEYLTPIRNKNDHFKIVPPPNNGAVDCQIVPGYGSRPPENLR